MRYGVFRQACDGNVSNMRANDSLNWKDVIKKTIARDREKLERERRRGQDRIIYITNENTAINVENRRRKQWSLLNNGPASIGYLIIGAALNRYNFLILEWTTCLYTSFYGFICVSRVLCPGYTGISARRRYQRG